MRKASHIAVLTEDESKLLIKMIDDRNLSSHIYREEIAQQLISAIPEYYQLISKLLLDCHDSSFLLMLAGL